MRILALETSTRLASVAALADDRLLGQSDFGSDQRTAQAFAPSMVRQLEAVGWKPGDVQLMVVSHGPGSFTGLRVGVTAAKTLAYATGAEILGVNTLQVIAAQATGPWQEITAVADAQRRQLFAARFRRKGQAWEVAEPTSIVDSQAWLRSLTEGQVVTGPGLARLRDPLPHGVMATPMESWLPRAETVGRIGYLDYTAGRRDDLWKLTPHYYRRSAAEEKHAAQAD
jgi:tRNA threonylcarbamoyladenosine biosynthesis protein TsaB